MKRKIIYLIIIVSMVLTIGLFSIKKTYAYDTIRTNPVSLSAEDFNPGIVMLFSLDISSNGAPMIDNSITIGSSTLSDIFDNTTIDDYNCYCFKDTQSGYTDVIINFYKNINNMQQRIIETIMLEEDTIISAYSNTITIQNVSFMALFFMPLNTIMQHAFLNLDTMTYETTQPTFNIYGNVYTTPVASETYINGYSGNAPLYEVNYSTQYITSTSGYHSNLIFTYTNIPVGIVGLQELIQYIFNPDMDLIAPYIYQFEVNGYRSGFQYGYASGLDANDTDAYQQGKDEGYRLGYNVGYDEGASAENAINPFWAIISSIGQGLSSILAIQLGRGITIGTLIFIPLFFAVLGLVLWIWRHN